MNASGKGRGYVNGKELTILLETAKTNIDFRKTSGLILTACRTFYAKNENEKAYQEWKAERKEKAG